MKISVIVPVFNRENMIKECVDSILAQSYADFELLLVDDGSKDSSGAICDEYAQKDSRVKVYHKENGGVSSARNVGLDNAQGEWVTFVDSDDLVLPGFFEVLSKIENLDDVDLVVCKWERLLSKTNATNLPCDEGFYSRQSLTQYLYYSVFVAPWGKFFKRNIIGSLRFDRNIRQGEDMIFNQYYFTHCKDIYLSNAFGYSYTPAGLQNSREVINRYALKSYGVYSFVEQLVNLCIKINYPSIHCIREIQKGYMFYRWCCLKEGRYDAPDFWQIDNIKKIVKDNLFKCGFKSFLILSLCLYAPRMLSDFLIKSKLGL